MVSQQGKQVMKKLDQRSPTKCSIESGPYTFQYVLSRVHPLQWRSLSHSHTRSVYWCSTAAT